MLHNMDIITDDDMNAHKLFTVWYGNRCKSLPVDIFVITHKKKEHQGEDVDISIRQLKIQIAES